MDTAAVADKRHRFLPQIIARAVWLYFRFPLSLRLVEEMLLERGITVSYETIRRWGKKFGPDYARRLRRKQPSRDDIWYLDVGRATRKPSYCAAPSTLLLCNIASMSGAHDGLVSNCSERVINSSNRWSPYMNLFSTYRNWRNYKVTIDELSRLSNRSLADIGMKRGDIRKVSRDAN